MADANLIKLMKDFDKEVLRKREDTMKGILNSENQIEGWLKGELIGFLYSNLGFKHGIEYETEPKVNGGNIDFRIEDNWIELKQLLIGLQKGTKYNAKYYITEKYFKGDVDKLISKDNAYFLILAIENPLFEGWEDAINNYNKLSVKSTITSLISPDKSSSKNYFLGLIKVEKKV